MSFQTNSNSGTWRQTSPSQKKYDEMYAMTEEFIKDQASKHQEQAGRQIEMVCKAVGRCRICTLLPPC